MPSGPKKRRAAARKKQEKAKAKQTDVVKLSVPIEELAKGAVWHEEASVEKESDKAMNTIGEVTDEFKVASVMGSVCGSADCIVECVKPGETLKINESSGGVLNDREEAELLVGESGKSTEEVHDRDLLSDCLMPEEIIARCNNLFVDVVAANEAATVFQEIEEAKLHGGGVSDECKDVSVIGNAVEGNEESLLEVTTVEDKEMSRDETVVPQSGHELLSVGAPEEKVGTDPVVSVPLISDDSIKEGENTSKFNEILLEVLPEEKKDTELVAFAVSSVSQVIKKASLFSDQSDEVSLGAFAVSSVSQEIEKTSLFSDQSDEVSEETKGSTLNCLRCVQC
ncbi:putative protein isoform X2 [Capsicum galapagoense]